MQQQQQRVCNTLPTMSEQPGLASSPSMVGSSPSMRGYNMPSYMDMNASLIHDHHSSGHVMMKDAQVSPLAQGLAGHGLPMPPPLSLPQAITTATNNGNVGVGAADVSQQQLAMLVDPLDLDDQILQLQYLKFRSAMETRGFLSQSSHTAPPAATATAAAAAAANNNSNNNNNNTSNNDNNNNNIDDNNNNNDSHGGRSAYPVTGDLPL